jgi:formylglycine-generating enzyme required for sulfatase activity
VSPGIHVLCIGISRYDFAPLTTAAASALKVFEALRVLPIKSARLVVAPHPIEEELVARLLPGAVETFRASKHAATRAELDQVLCAWFEQTRGDPRDTAIFYFAGHGLGLEENPGQESKTLLLASDYAAEYARAPRAITLEHVMAGLQPAPAADPVARQQLFLLDCCRTEAWQGPGAEQGDLRIRAADRSQAERHAPDDRRIAVQYACRARDRAWSSDNDAAQSELVTTNYAQALVASLERLARLPELHVDYLLKHVTATLQQLYPHQEPRRGRADDFPLRGAQFDPARPSAQVRVIQGARADSRATTVLQDLASNAGRPRLVPGTQPLGVSSASPPPDHGVVRTPRDGVSGSSRRPSARWAWFGGAMVVGAAMVLAAWKHADPSQSAPSAVPASMLTASVTQVAAPEGMVLVPSAEFRPGSSPEQAERAYRDCLEYGKSRGFSLAALPRELPCSRSFEASLFQRETRLSTSARRIAAFYLDRLEVTNRAFTTWLNVIKRDLVVQDAASRGTPWVALRNRPPLASITTGTSRADIRIGLRRDQFTSDAEASELPVTAVTWEGASKYCEAQGKRLPSELEWELAARGTEQRELPWGASPPTCSGVCFGRSPALDCASSPPSPVAVGSSSQDKTELGIADLAGNVAEWTADAYTNPPPGEPPCTTDPNGSCRVVRGGGYSDAPAMLRAAMRSRLSAAEAAPNIGFRCAKDAP